VETIRRLHSQGVAVVSICVGAFLLGEAGLLDGRDSTTSWIFADELARRHPTTRVCADRLVVTDRGITTTAAFSAMFDFALGLVREHHGPDIARGTARIALVDDVRSRQTPYVDVGLLPTTGAGFSRTVQRWLDQRLADRYDLGVLSAAFNVSSRTMLRRFGHETGETPLSYLQHSRVRRARHLLETTDRTIGDIAAQVGYQDAGTFARLFARHVGQSPRAYRQSFQQAPLCQIR
jgi:transcriptional regulator GlxA family with amidase domain